MFKCTANVQKMSYDIRPHYGKELEKNIEKIVFAEIPKPTKSEKTISRISVQPSGTVYVFYSDGSDETVQPENVHLRGWIKF